MGEMWGNVGKYVGKYVGKSMLDHVGKWTVYETCVLREVLCAHHPVSEV